MIIIIKIIIIIIIIIIKIIIMIIFRLILKPISKFLKFKKFENEKCCPKIMLFCFFFLLTSDSFINKYYLKLIEISEEKKSYISYSIIRAWPNLGNF